VARAGDDTGRATVKRLDFIASLLCQAMEGDEGKRLLAAKRAGLTARDVAIIFGRTELAARKALQRAK
jgi:hypothetical protein